ncbi:MAG: hypothetical protein JMDDDDMK_04727 [Acidobacteria bacterium]|nr:hypothetical protein [Acidobacteriota bacterium]
MNSPESLRDARRLFLPVLPAVNGLQDSSARANRPGLFVVNRRHVVKQLARGRLLHLPRRAAVGRALNRSRFADSPTDPVVRKSHSQQDRIGRPLTRFQRVRTFVRFFVRDAFRLSNWLLNRQASQRARLPFRAAIFARQQKDSLAPINAGLAVEQCVFAEQQSAISVKKPDVIQRLVLLTFWQRLAAPLRPAVFRHEQRPVAAHYPTAITVNEKGA